ncbi:hypothetical protein [Ornithinimicrobium murale]|uniref:hypothetical protein n=1 Tax=Ornithinimicrobium murale TaxID=1050153 RepID=UPI00307C00D9
MRTEVLAVDRTAKRVRVRDLDTGTEYDETYDDLILSTGLRPSCRRRRACTGH